LLSAALFIQAANVTNATMTTDDVTGTGENECAINSTESEITGRSERNVRWSLINYKKNNYTQKHADSTYAFGNILCQPII
jgi:hypothetical protein